MALHSERAQLLSWLQTALELELATIPPYLTALLSIEFPGNRQAAELIRGVMVEEMLHVALVANVLSAIGGRPRIGRSNLPSYPLTMTFEGKAFRDRRFAVNLAPFSPDTIATFMKIEMPRKMAAAAELPEGTIDIPGLTIGEFYEKIVARLEELDTRLPDGIFTRSERQLCEDYYWAGGGVLRAVHDLHSAKEALALVIAQGEGAWSIGAFDPGPNSQPAHLGHYFRFSEIYHGRLYDKDDDPAAPPTGPAIPIDYEAVHSIRINARASDYAPGSVLDGLNTAFNRRYTRMLKQIEEAVNGSPKSLYTAIADGMHSLPPLALKMMQTPIDGDPEGRSGCPTFDWSETSAAPARPTTVPAG